MHHLLAECGQHHIGGYRVRQREDGEQFDAFVLKQPIEEAFVRGVNRVLEDI